MSINFVSHSSLRSFQECPKKYTYLYHDKRVPNTTSPALQVGTFVHEALDQWWSHDLEAARDWMTKNAGELTSTEAAKVAAMLSFYNPPRDDFDLIENEAKFEHSIETPDGGVVHGYRIVGFADGLLTRKSDGAIVVRECKTTASEILGFGAFWQRLSIDSQIGIYAVVFDVETVVYDVLRKPGLKISQADKKAAAAIAKAEDREPNAIDEAAAYQRRVEDVIAKEPEAFHQWREIRVDDNAKDIARRNLFDSVTALKQAHDANCFPMHTGSCSGFGTCKYLGVCTGRDDLSDPVSFRDKLSREEREAAAKAKAEGGAA